VADSNHRRRRAPRARRGSPGHCCGQGMPHCKLVGWARESRDQSPPRRSRSGDRRIQSPFEAHRSGWWPAVSRADRQNGATGPNRQRAPSPGSVPAPHLHRAAPGLAGLLLAAEGQALAGRQDRAMRRTWPTEVERFCLQGLFIADVGEHQGAPRAPWRHRRRENRTGPGPSGPQADALKAHGFFAAGVRSGESPTTRRARCGGDNSHRHHAWPPAWRCCAEQKGVAQPVQPARGRPGSAGELGPHGAELQP